MKNKMKKLLYIFIGTAIFFGGFVSGEEKLYAASTNNFSGGTEFLVNGTYSTGVYYEDNEVPVWQSTYGANGDMPNEGVLFIKNEQGGIHQAYAINGKEGALDRTTTDVSSQLNTDRGALAGSPQADAAINRIVAANGGSSQNATEAVNKSIQSTQSENQKRKANGHPDLPPCLEFSTWHGLPNNFNWDGCIAQASYYVFLKPASFFLWAAGWFFNFTLGYSLNMGDFIKQVPIVDIGWKIFRDVANMCFIFILLYIAINTILQTKSADTKRLLINVIIIAILLNFSLFFAKVVIDTSNIIALQFYEKMGGKQVTSLTANIENQDKGIAQTFLNGLGLSSIYENGKIGDSVQPITSAGNVIAVTLGGTVLILVTAFVFIAGAILFIIRTIVLIFIMILAPLAFLAMVLPQTKKYWDQWLSALISQSFFASLYMILVYLVVAIVSGEYGSESTVDKLQTATKGGKNLGTFLMGNGDSAGTLYVFVILIGLMMAALFVAKTLGAHGGDFARNMAGKATFGLGGWMGRQTMGRMAQGYMGTDQAKRDKDGNFAQRARYNLNNSLAKGSYDMRGSALGAAAGGAVGGLGTVGGEGGYQKFAEEKKKRESDLAKTMLIQGKKAKLTTALAMKEGTTAEKAAKDAAVQAALIDFTDSEYAELGNSILSDHLVVKHSSHSQILAATDAKNEKLNEGQKSEIQKIRLSELNSAINGETGARSVESVLGDMGDDEKAALPLNILAKPEVFRHLGRGVQDQIAKRKNLTAIQHKELEKARGDALADAANPATFDESMIEHLMKGMSAKELIKLHAASGSTLLDTPHVAKYIKGTHLKEMAELGGITNPAAIGAVIDGWGTDAAAHSYLAKPTNRPQWGL